MESCFNPEQVKHYLLYRVTIINMLKYEGKLQERCTRCHFDKIRATKHHNNNNQNKTLDATVQSEQCFRFKSSPTVAVSRVSMTTSETRTK